MNMKLNTIEPAYGSKVERTRVGRGIGSGLGKTSGRGHKGQKARAGGFHKTGFEGGQMPLQRRLPKFGFTSRVSLVSGEVRLNELNYLPDTVDVVNIETLRAANIITKTVKFAKVFGDGELSKALTIGKGVKVSKSARAAIVAAGGKVEE